MNLLNRQYDSYYEELVRYYPRYYMDVREMIAILKAHGAICDTLGDNIEQVYSNNFIDEMDEDSIATMENMLGIALNKSRTLEERRRLVKAYFIGFGTISASMLKETIYAYTGAEVDITFEPFDDEGNNMLIIRIARGDEETVYMSDILWLLAKKIPAHIYYQADLWYDFPGVVIGGGRKRRTFTTFQYPLAGTRPDIVKIGDLNLVSTVVESEALNVISDYALASESQYTGTKPTIVKTGVLNEVSTATEASAVVCGIDYIFCGEDHYASES
ncbi:MAG: YmfQ family protein [Clostridiales bacterium]|nr:YmfQ family protein [Clostridiales bacterium]